MAKATTTPYDFNSLTMREIAQIERLSGQGLASLGDDDRPKALLLAAIAYTFKLRENKAYTWNEAQDLTLEDMAAITSSLDSLTITDGTEDAEPDTEPAEDIDAD